MIGLRLGNGFGFLEFGIWNFFGIWSLRFGICERSELDVSDDDFDVVLFVAVEFLEFGGGEKASVGAHEGVAVFFNPCGDGLMVAFASANERGAEVEVFGFFRARVGGEDFCEMGAELRGREWFDGKTGVGVVLGAEAGVEEAQVLGDFGDGGDGGFARASRDALLDGDGGRDAGEPVDVGARELFDKLARVGRHGFHEAALALGKNDVECERAFTGTGYSGDDVELPMRNGEREVFEVVFTRADNSQRRRGMRRRVLSGEW